jgi:cytochrome c553
MIRRVILIVLGVIAVLTWRPSPGPTRPERDDAATPLSSRTPLRHWIAGAVATIVGAGLFGGLVLISGIVPIKASSGHWRITAWFLDFAKSRSVATYTLGMSAPPLEDNALAMKGASHFDFGCAPCHGSPLLEQPTIARQMTPRPPALRSAASEFDRDELFYIVKHGIKFTGMPAWPALQRDDEVWSVVAFLQRLPALDANGYRELAAPVPISDLPDPLDALVPPSRTPAAVRESCARCHGFDGLGRSTGAFPVLAGQKFEYLLASLQAYARGRRYSGIMQPASAPLDPGEMQSVAAYYSGLGRNKAKAVVASADPDLLERGRIIASRGVPDRLVPPCLECHGERQPRNPLYPLLWGQYEEYIALQLQLFRAGNRGGTDYSSVMRKVAATLSDDDVRAAARYFASYPSDRMER